MVPILSLPMFQGTFRGHWFQLSEQRFMSGTCEWKTTILAGEQMNRLTQASEQTHANRKESLKIFHVMS